MGRDSSHTKKGFGLLVKQLISLLLAIAAGYLIGNFSVLAGYAVEIQSIHISDPPLDFLNDFRLLESRVAILNALFVSLSVYWVFFRSAAVTLKVWCLLIATEALIIIAETSHGVIDGWLSKVVALGAWVMIMSGVISGFWICYGWRKNRKARELLAADTRSGELKIE